MFALDDIAVTGPDLKAAAAAVEAARARLGPEIGPVLDLARGPQRLSTAA